MAREILQPVVNPDQGRVLNKSQTPTHPLVKGRTADVGSDPIHRAMEEMAMIDSRRQLAGK